MAETKGTGFARDPAVAAKAKAAQEWCRAASTAACRWEYLYIPQQVFEAFAGDEVTALAGACKPSLVRLLKDAASPQLTFDVDADESRSQVEAFMDPNAYAALPSADRVAIRQAIQLFDFMSGKPDALLAPVFQPLLGRIDHAAEAVLLARLGPDVPSGQTERESFFDASGKKFLAERCRTLKRLLVTRSPIMPTGVLLFCLEYAAKPKPDSAGILQAVEVRFSDLAATDLAAAVKKQYDFRNEYIAHEKREPLRSVDAARAALGVWTGVLQQLRAVNVASPGLEAT